jgi:hypothetical protein
MSIIEAALFFLLFAESNVHFFGIIFYCLVKLDPQESPASYRSTCKSHQLDRVCTLYFRENYIASTLYIYLPVHAAIPGVRCHKGQSVHYYATIMINFSMVLIIMIHA